MAEVQNKPKPLFTPGQREREDFQAPQSLLDVLKGDGDFTIHYGRLHGELSYYLIGLLKGQYYSYKIGNVTRFEELKERFEERGGRFKKNVATNPFIWWEVLSQKLDIPLYEARCSGDYYYGAFGGITYRTSIRKNANLLDFAREVGVYTEGY